MPDEFTRHGRTREWGGESQPSRSQARAAAARTGETSARKGKNTRTPKPECTASPDGLHHGEGVRLVGYGTRKKSPREIKCEWVPRWYRRDDATPLVRWDCRHTEYCRECGNKIADTMGLRCPDYTDDGPQKREAERRALELEAERANRPLSEWKRRKIPNGRQSFRRKKGEA